MRYRPYRHRRGGLPGAVFGLLIVLAGVLLLLDNLNILDIGQVWRWWPVALIAIGAAKIISAYGAGGRIWGGMLMLAGGFFLLRSLGYLSVEASRFIWPLLLIGFGVHMLVRAVERRKECAPGELSVSRLGEWAVFGGTKRQITTQDFEGGEALAIFGGVELDLRGAVMQKEQVTVDANAMFGGVEIRVPETWTVTVKGVGIFGGYEDKTVPPRDGARPQHLIVTGYAIFGGVTVQN